jgi:hypothetical protein
MRLLGAVVRLDRLHRLLLLVFKKAQERVKFS